MNKEIIRLFESTKFKRTIFFLGVIFFILIVFISIDPSPFLKFGYIGVFVFNLFGTGTLLIIPLSKYMNVFGLAFASASGMAINDSISWIIGKSGDSVVPRSNKTKKIENSINKFGPVALFFWSLIPIPYDIIGFIAGYLGLSYKGFILPTFLGKFVRFVLLGYGALEIFT